MIVANAVNVIELQCQWQSSPLGNPTAAARVLQNPLAHEPQLETAAIVVGTILDENLGEWSAPRERVLLAAQPRLAEEVGHIDLILGHQAMNPAVVRPRDRASEAAEHRGDGVAFRDCGGQRIQRPRLLPVRLPHFH
jgi:hypothetical protein